MTRERFILPSRSNAKTSTDPTAISPNLAVELLLPRAFVALQRVAERRSCAESPTSIPLTRPWCRRETGSPRHGPMLAEIPQPTPNRNAVSWVNGGVLNYGSLFYLLDDSVYEDDAGDARVEYLTRLIVSRIVQLGISARLRAVTKLRIEWTANCFCTSPLPGTICQLKMLSSFLVRSSISYRLVNLFSGVPQ